VLIAPTPTFPFDPIVVSAEQSDGHSVLVLPTPMRGDRYTARVRRFPTSIGYSVHRWDLRVNVGITKRLRDGAADRLSRLSDEHGTVSLVGFSMDGLFARWLAYQTPDRVRQVITVCSPIHQPASNFWLPL